MQEITRSEEKKKEDEWHYHSSQDIVDLKKRIEENDMMTFGLADISGAGFEVIDGKEDVDLDYGLIEVVLSHFNYQAHILLMIQCSSKSFFHHRFSLSSISL